jgi:hypothetical protein
MRSTSGIVVSPAVDDLLLGRGVDDLPRARRHGPALLQVKVLERGPIVIVLKDVLGHDIVADVELVTGVKEEPWGGRLELDHDGIVVDRLGTLDKLLHVNTPRDIPALPR